MITLVPLSGFLGSGKTTTLISAAIAMQRTGRRVAVVTNDVGSSGLVDSVAHAWDVARSIDAPVAFDDEVLDAALIISLAIPDGPAREQPGSAFRPGIGVGWESPSLDRILGLLGRSPEWKP